MSKKKMKNLNHAFTYAVVKIEVSRVAEKKNTLSSKTYDPNERVWLLILTNLCFSACDYKLTVIVPISLHPQEDLSFSYPHRHYHRFSHNTTSG